jgi:heme/copper-type cytochrome/quinol oxidase subunit 2
MNEEEKAPITEEAPTAEAPKVETAPVRPMPVQPVAPVAPAAAANEAKIKAMDTTGNRVACIILLIVIALLFVRAFSVLAYHKQFTPATDPDHEGLYRLGIWIDLLFIVICNIVVTVRSAHLFKKFTFYKVMIFITLLVWAGGVFLI